MRLSFAPLFAPVVLIACGGIKDRDKDNAPPPSSPVAAESGVTEALPVEGAAPSSPAAQPATVGAGTVSQTTVVPVGPEVGLPIFYAREEFAASNEVFKDFGPLTIDPNLVAEVETLAKINVVKVADGNLPWSGYWYPKRETQLFNGDASPMRKLDSYLQSFDLPSSAQDWERERHEPQASEWEGLCDAWAVASVLTKEPKQSFTENGVNFSPSDLKALAIKYFEGYSSKIYGRRYLGIAETDGQMQDLRPEAFHKLVEEVIGKQQRPLLVDEDPGQELWSKPLFRMSYKYSKDPVVKNAIIVKAFPWMIRQRGAVDDLPTSINSDLAAPSYEYRLYYEAGSNPYKIVAGEWMNASLNAHPDMVFIPSDARNSKQYNPSVQVNNEVVRKLLVSAGMLTEQN